MSEFVTGNVLTFGTGQPTTGEATVKVGDGPALTRDQVAQVLAAGGVPPQRAVIAASMLMKGTTYPPLVQRTAQDVMNEHLVEKLRSEKALLLRALATKVSPLWMRALSVLGEDVGMTSAMLAERLGVSSQQGANISADLLALGLVERKHIGSPHPDFTGPGRTPYWWTAVDAVKDEATS